MTTLPADLAAPNPSRSRLAVPGYYLAVFLPIVAMLGGVAIRLSVPLAFEYTPLAIVVVVLSQVGVVGAVVWSAFALYAFLRFGSPSDSVPGPGWNWDPETKLIVTYVSRGDQPLALQRSITTTLAVLCEYGVNWELEAVTDIAVADEYRVQSAAGPILYELVPANYQTPRQARFKARALQYLLERRTARLEGAEATDNLWILHLDEESTLTPEALVGIRKFTAHYDLRNSPGAIGQGEILYNAGRYGADPLIETVDAVRTGDDLGRFRAQFAVLHRPVFGMHGSFVLVPARIERAITWDGGGRGSITEDAWFALSAMERGVRFDWVEGFIREQSPFTLLDLIQQRRRWFCGLSAVAADESLRRSTRLVLQFCVLSWALGSVSLIFGLLTAAAFGPTAFPPWIMVNMAVCGGAAIAVYSVGAFRNVLDRPLPWRRRLWIVVQTVVAVMLLWPPLVEGMGVLYALWKPMTSFYIVRKELA